MAEAPSLPREIAGKPREGPQHNPPDGWLSQGALAQAAEQQRCPQAAAMGAPDCGKGLAQEHAGKQ